MEKMSGESMNLLNENIEKLKALFPEIVTDGKIDFDMLKTLLGEEVDASNEKYSFNWVGKRNCIKFAQTPSTGTLIPCKEKSVDFDNTQNIYIEGDNVEALKLLQKTYFGKIKMIYIDPPYNTGNDFVYHDDYKDSIENYKKITGQQATANPETNGRFHTDWLNMMYPRLKLAKDLLSDDGVIFVSIDENEVHNLKKICDEIFCERNLLTCVTRATGTPTGGGFDGMVNELDYMLIYAKNIEQTIINGLPMGEEDSKIYDQEDEYGRYLIRPLRRTGGEDRREDRPTMYFPIIAPDGTPVYPIGPTGYESRWICSPDTAKKLAEEHLLTWKKSEKDGVAKWIVYQKFYLENRTKAPGNLWNNIEGNKKATRDIRTIFDNQKVFDFPKPIGFIEKVLQIGSNQDSIILDFFSGSATTAHAVMQLNAEDGGNRKFIMVQLPELCDEKSEAYKAGYKTICDIGEERIRRAGAKIKEENPLTTLNLDTGFKVFRLDSTNIVPWNNAEKLDEMCLYDYAKTIKDGRDDLSVAYEIMLKYGVFDKPMKETVVSGKKMYDVGEGYMIICLADGVTMTDVEAIARLNPHCVVFKESGFADDNEKINATHTLERGGVEKILCI